MKTGHSGSGLIPMHSTPNAHHWHHVADFLSVTAGAADAAACGKRSAQAAVADVSAIPDGNHGDNNLSTVTGDRS